MSRKRHLESLPGMQDPSKLNLAGAKLLGAPEGPVYSQHQTTFQMTQTSISARVSDDGNVVGYLMVTRDEAERHTYILPFDQALKSHFQETFNALPNVGDKIPEDHPEKPTLN